MSYTQVKQSTHETRIVAPPSELQDDKLLANNIRKTLVTEIRASLWKRYINHSHQIGAGRLDAKKSPKKNVDCIRYVRDSIADGYDAIGYTETANKIRKTNSGMELAKILQARNWRIVYYNANTAEEGNNGENKYTLNEYNAHKTYYRNKPSSTVKVDDAWLDFGVKSPNFDPSTIEKINKEEIGFISAFGGTHTALLRDGAVYEVHRDQDSVPIDPQKLKGLQESPDKLYEKTDFNKWHKDDEGHRYKAGVVILPPNPLATSNFPQ